MIVCGIKDVEEKRFFPKMPKTELKKKCANPNCKNPNCPFPHYDVVTKPIKEAKPKRSSGAAPYNPNSFLRLIDIRTIEPSIGNQAPPGATKERNSPTVDVVRKCLHCRQHFTLPIAEQEWYQNKNFQLPKRCKDCRDIIKANGSGGF